VGGYTAFSKFGYNADLDIGTETVWKNGGTYTPLTTARTLSVVSDSANDASAGSGARTITILGVNASRVSQTETVTMNGLTPVVTSGSWLGVNRVTVATAGATGYNEGNLTLTAATDLTVQAYVGAGDSITNQMIYHAPVGFNAYVTRVVLSVDKASAGGQPVVAFTGYVVSPTGIRTIALYDILNGDYHPHLDSLLQNPFPISGGSYFWINATSDVNNTFVRARIEMTLLSS
jgi:hypothetical protein